MYIFKILPTVSLLGGIHAAAPTFCKRDPTFPQWPSAQQWQALNSSVSGSLRVPIAPAAICHPGQPNFNNDTCTAFLKNWTNTDWVAQNSFVVDYNDDTCLPSPLAPCSTAGYPAYVIEAKTPQDVAAGITFARNNQVRLIVKGTGHDFPGRSSGPGSLSIWTHQLRGVEVNMNDSKAVQYGGVAAVKIYAGMRMKEIYTEAVKYNITVVGGADPNVGIGGWIAGGGHGPVSAKFGMGADQVLEMDVVTTSGRILTINETQHSDLFWAMRGGGGSTYAVMLSVTVKAYSAFPSTQYAFAYNSTTDSDTYWAMVARFHADLPRVSAAGGMGYYYILPLSPLSSSPIGSILGLWIFPERSEEQVKTIMSPWEDMLNTGPSWATANTSAYSITTSSPNFLAYWLSTNDPQGGGSLARLGSWLFDAPALTANISNMATQLRKITPAPLMLLGHLVAGAGTHNVTVPGGSNAVLPAWRKALTHVVATAAWAPLNLTSKNQATQRLRDEVIPILKSLGPDSGAYMNEADPTNPSWKQDYYGSNYNRLSVIKKKWDPEGVFWCKPCVGHDEWALFDGPAGEDSANWGVAQVGAKICKNSTAV